MTGIQNEATKRAARLATLPFEEAGSRSALLQGTVASVVDIWRHRELLGLLTRRELKARYKDSVLGFVWSLIKPLTQLLIYAVVVGQFLGAAQNVENFAVYLFAGLTVYLLFSEVVGTATSSILTNAGLIKKVYFPREIFPVSAVGSAMVNFLIQLVILLIAALFSGTLTFGPHLLYGLGSIAVILIYATAIGLLLSAVNVYLRDIQYLLEVVLMLIMWGSPILYHWTIVTEVVPGWLAEIYLDNPITLAVIGFQEAFWAPGSNGETLPMLGVRLLVAGVIGLIFLFIAQRVFARLQGNFAQEL